MSLLEPEACEAIDPEALLGRSVYYARREGAGGETLARLAAFCQDPVTRAILALPEAELCSVLVNDAYKARMHRLYARYMPGVMTDFELSVRRTPMPLAQIREEDPELWRRFQQACSDRLGVPPYPPAVVEALDTCFPHFRCSQEMLVRSERHGVAPLTWQDVGGQPVAFSHGPVEASSHVETTLTQLVQEVTIAAQVRRLERLHGIKLVPTEMLASALAKLALGVESLAADAQAQAQAQAARLLAAPGQPAEAPPALMLFAGRRSSSRRYLLLQNWYCMQYLPQYQGTSAIMAVTLLRQLLQQQGQSMQQTQREQHAQQEPDVGGGAQQQPPPQQQQQQQQPPPQQQQRRRRQQLPLPGQGEPAGRACQHPQQAGREQQQQALQQHQQGAGTDQQPPGRPLLRLVGTLAHEVMMVCDQLLGCFDELSGTTCGAANGPVLAQVCALLAHLLLLAAGGGLQTATALSDTFGTRGFVSAALAARIPPEFCQDVQQQYPDQWAALPEAVRAPGAKVFDLFSWWRMDSGDYKDMATHVMDAWEARWAGQPSDARPLRPRLMHSNLESFDEIVDVWRLPARIRPAACAFGTLADGFLPFDVPTRRGGGAGSAGGASSGDAGGADGGAGAAGGTAGGGGQVSIQLASVVMKAVQNRARGDLPCSTESAGKLGDDTSASKAQFDRRLPPDSVERTRQRMQQLSREQPELCSEAVSAALAAAYHAVTRDGVLR